MCKQRDMMGFIYAAVALLSFLSGGQSAPVTSCQSQIQPIEIRGRDQLLGQWMLIAESTNIVGSRLLTKMFVDNSWVKITAANESDAVDVVQYTKTLGQCFSHKTKVTLQNNTLSMVKPFIISEVLLNTGCPDCCVVYSTYTVGGNTYSGLQLISRRRNVTAAELEEFKKQAECVNLPPPAILDPEKGLCPDESLHQQSQTVDLTSFTNDMASDVFDLLDSFISSDKQLFKTIFSANAEEN